jgi:hypothetical protein
VLTLVRERPWLSAVYRSIGHATGMAELRITSEFSYVAHRPQTSCQLQVHRLLLGATVG